MYIKSVIIDGFKSYGRRTEIHGFDPEFTAITGLNGTGKSNILDAICFVLGISNLGQVRATSLQDLIFKSGQAGITKATVTLVFDNTDPAQCPFGYEKCREISVTRQIVMGGKNKYMINGKNVLNKKVTDLFCSIQLNVNNPNFLIMQGRITKVLNMKPQEILSMIEEAAGTSLYESKKEASCKLIEKKDAKIRETNILLKEEIEPKLEKLRKERAAYIEFQKVCRDIEYLTRIHISYKYLKQKESLKKTEENVNELILNVENSKKIVKQNEMEIIQIDKNCENLQIKIDSQNDGELHKLEELLSSKQKAEAANLGKKKALKEQIDQDNRKVNALKKSIKDDENTLTSKQNQMKNFENCFKELKEAAENDLKLYTESQKKFEAITQGLSTNDDGDAATLQDQLMTAKTQIIEAQTTIKKSEMELEHMKNLLRQKKNETQTNDSMYLKDKSLHDKLTEEIKKITIEMSKMNYEDGYFEDLEKRRMQLSQNIRDLQIELDRKGSYRYDLKYNDPEPNFDRRKVHGMVGKLFRVKNENDCLALMMCASGSLYSYVTDDDITSKKILQKGQLQKRVTIIPINKITSSPIQSNVIRFAQNLVGEENVCSALSLIDYDNYFDPVMKYVFGHTLICKDINIAKQVTYHKNIMCRSVTLEGDVLDPQGTLSGGARPKGANVLKELSDIMNIEEKLRTKERELYEIKNKIEHTRQTSKSYNALKEKLELRQHELSACSERLSQTAFQQNQQEIQDLKRKIESLENDLVNAKKMQANSNKKVKDIEMKLSDSKGYRERELKLAQDTMIKAKKKYEESEKNWKKREQEYETLKLELEEIQKSIESTRQQLNEMITNLEKLNAEMKEFEDKSKDAKEELNELKQKIKEKKDHILQQNKELKKNYNLKEKLNKELNDLNLDIKKKEIEISKIKASNKDNYDHITQLENKYSWIQEDYEFFGVKNTRYDYSKEDPVAAGAKLTKMYEQKDKMERNINLKAMMLLDREEEKYKETMRRKKIVEEDKEKIKNIICKMEEKKREKIDIAWKSVDKNFSSIFSTLLPGAQAKLKPIYQNNKLYGLEITVGFNGIWKESLGELSGGQRSLVALSLVLAMLKFSPAPLYILDEVDAALDMSHTQNIGGMLKVHFTNSQFIIVSLKDGMFNNANVLFRTKFEEGVSGVTRTVNKNRRN